MIPVLSLMVAALAVFISPWVSWLIAKRQGENLKRQIEASLEVATKQITAPMRQAWINNLRDNIAELSGTALHYFVAGFEDREDEDYWKLTLLEHKVRLMLNPNEEDHQRLEAVIREMMEALERRYKARDDNNFVAAYEEVMKLSRQVFKREWNRVKDPIALPRD